MISWMIIINEDVTVDKIIWCEPEGLFMLGEQAEKNLVNKDFMADFINKAASGNSSLETYGTEIISLGKKYEVSVFLMHLNEKIIMTGFEGSVSEQKKYMHVYKNLMLYIKKCYENNLGFSQENTRYQFEEIQKLNNQLVNTRRELEKVNIKLNVLNKELNNKLVKDELTGLTSRYQYRTEMKELMTKNPGKKGIFTFIDIDDFKKINDNYGHAAGDGYLVEFAERLKKINTGENLKIRIAGDEFGLFIYGYENVENIHCEKIWKDISEKILFGPIENDGIKMELSISAGMAVLGSDTNEIYEIVEYSDFAMYKAKKRGKNCYNIFNITEYKKEKE